MASIIKARSHLQNKDHLGRTTSKALVPEVGRLHRPVVAAASAPRQVAAKVAARRGQVAKALAAAGQRAAAVMNHHLIWYHSRSQLQN